jgi:hypothetical protein
VPPLVQVVFARRFGEYAHVNVSLWFCLQKYCTNRVFEKIRGNNLFRNIILGRRDAIDALCFAQNPLNARFLPVKVTIISPKWSDIDSANVHKWFLFILSKRKDKIDLIRPTLQSERRRTQPLPQ